MVSAAQLYLPHIRVKVSNRKVLRVTQRLGARVTETARRWGCLVCSSYAYVQAVHSDASFTTFHGSERPLRLNTTMELLASCCCAPNYLVYKIHQALAVCTCVWRALPWLFALLPLGAGRAGGGRLLETHHSSGRRKGHRRTEGADKSLPGNVSTSLKIEPVGACILCASQVFILTGRQEERFFEISG